MPSCPVLSPNTLSVVDKDGDPIISAKTGETVSICTYFPFQAQWKLGIYDDKTRKVFQRNVINNSTGNVTALTFEDPGTYYFKAAVCYGSWVDSTCDQEGRVESLNTVTINVSGTPTTVQPPPITDIPTWRMAKKYPLADTYKGEAVRETQNWGIPVLSRQEGFNAIIAIIEQFKGDKQLLNISTVITDKGSYFDYTVDVDYVKVSKLSSMQAPIIIPIVEVITPYLGVLLGGIILYLVLTKVEAIVYGVTQAPREAKVTIIILAGIAAALYLLSTGELKDIVKELKS